MADVNKVRITNPFMTSKGTPTIGIFLVTKDNSNNPMGVLGLNVDLPVVTDMISEIKIGETGNMVVVDADGVILHTQQIQNITLRRYRRLKEILQVWPM